jgi:hypothetical protein
MSGSGDTIVEYRLGQVLDGFDGRPATVSDLERSVNLQAFVVKVHQPDGSSQYQVAVIGAISLSSERILEDAIMAIGHEMTVHAKLEDIFVVDADLYGPCNFDINETMDDYYERSRNTQ